VIEGLKGKATRAVRIRLEKTGWQNNPDMGGGWRPEKRNNKERTKMLLVMLILKKESRACHWSQGSPHDEIKDIHEKIKGECGMGDSFLFSLNKAKA